MEQPSVCAICLTRDRPEMTKQAIAWFRAQTYTGRKRLLIWDTTSPRGEHLGEREGQPGQEVYHCFPPYEPTIGELRNAAITAVSWLSESPEIIVHWDSDDYSHPSRIAEQVALLQSSGKECVGYREMLFWDQREGQNNGFDALNEAWLYSHPNPAYCLGTSLCYWRKTWERRPFEALPRPGEWLGEDTAWLRGVDSMGVSSIGGIVAYDPPYVPMGADDMTIFAQETSGDPRMVARIHGGNTSPAYNLEMMRASEKQGGEWRRVPQWDDFARRTMEGE